MDDGSVTGPPALVMGAATDYNGGDKGEVATWFNVFPRSAPLYELDLVAADNGQAMAGEGDMQAALLARSAFTDGTAAFQLWLYKARFVVPPPWALTAGQIAAIVLAVLFVAWFTRFVYYDYTYRVFFFDKPLVEAPPPAEPAFDPTLKTIEQALAMHESTSAVVPEEAPVPLAPRVKFPEAAGGDSSIAFSHESHAERDAALHATLAAEEAARIAEALAEEEAARARGAKAGGWFGRANKIAPVIEKPDPLAVAAAREREEERRKNAEAARAASDALDELIGPQ